MKKRLPIILICVALLISLIAPTFAVAEGVNEQITHLIKPTSIAIEGNYLYVADNVDDQNNQSVVLCFDISQDKPTYCYSHSLQGVVNKLSVSEGKLYALMSDKIVALNLAGNTQPTTDKEFAIANAIDFAYGTSACVLTSDKVLLPEQDSEWGITVTNAKSLLFLGNYHYYLANDCTRFNSNGTKPSGDKFNEKFSTPGTATPDTAKGLFAWGDNLGIYGTSTVFQVMLGETNFVANATITDLNYNITSVANYKTSDVDRVYILTDSNKINVYKLQDGAYKDLGEDFTIGSDKVKIDVPTKYTAFTLAKPIGYPTNVIYKTNNSDNSIQEINISYNGYYIILDHDNANADYYYVLVDNKFGWVKKSDGATTPQTDNKLQVVDTSVSNVVTFNAKFNSLGSVYVYDLPCSVDSTRTLLEEVQQTASTQRDVVILQKFTENANVSWYLVQYDQNKLGFVKTSDVGQFTPTPKGDVAIIDSMQINATLFNAVTLHVTDDLDANAIVTIDGEPLKLYSGDKVKVIEQRDGVAFVQYQYTFSDEESGETTTMYTYGWMENARLLPLDQMTTNAIVGLVALGVAIVLIIVFVSVFVKRKSAEINHHE